MHLRIVMLGDRVVIADKPSGMLTIPGREGAADPRPCLTRELSALVPGKLWIVHRLDREVSGLVIFARDAEAHRLLNGWFEHRLVEKEYEAWTEGDRARAASARGRWEGHLIRGRRRVHEGERGKLSVTDATYAGTVMRDGATRLRWTLIPRTGRPHQLRCQASARGFAILGDALYGASAPYLPDAIALREVRIAFPGADRVVLRELELPSDLRVDGLSAAVRGDG